MSSPDPRHAHRAMGVQRLRGKVLVGILCLALALVTAPLSMLGASPARGNETSDVEVIIDDVSPAIIDVTDPDQVVTVSGTIRNVSDRELTYLAVHMWGSRDPITTPSELANALASSPSNPIGSRLQQEHLGHLEIISREEPFVPGQETSFSVQATVAELELSQDDAAYVLGAHVRIVGRETVGRGRSLVVATQDPLPRSLVVELAHRPTRDTDGMFLNEDLGDALRGPLMELTRGAAEIGATVLLDPLLLADVQAMSEPHSVNGVPAEALPEAEEWLGIIDDLMVDDRVLRLPYANSDVARLATMGELSRFQGWADGLVEPWLRSLPTTTTVGATATPEMLQTLADTGFRSVLATNMTSGTVDDMQVLQVAGWDRPGIGPGPSNTPAQLQSRRFAEQLLAPIPPIHLITTVDELDIAEHAAEEQVSLPLPEAADRAPRAVVEPQPIEGWPGLVSDVDELADQAEFAADLTGVDESQTLRRTAVTATSASWAGEPEARAWLGGIHLATMDPSLVTISAAGQFVMGSRTNDFPVTIHNGMDTDIQVRLTFTSDLPQRIRVPPTDLVTIPAGQMETLNVAPQASSNGVVIATAQLETAGGQRFGESVPIQITATDLGRVGWIIIIISGAVVLGGTAWRIRTVRAEQAKESSEQHSQ